MYLKDHLMYEIPVQKEGRETKYERLCQNLLH